jgi:hypothetical protein
MGFTDLNAKTIQLLPDVNTTHPELTARDDPP